MMLKLPLLLRFIIGVAAFTVFSPLVAAAATWYVDPFGNGDAQTIQGGIDLAGAGDTVLVACGTYNEHDIAMMSGVTLRSETGLPDCVTINGGDQGQIMTCNGDASTRVEGFTLTGGNNSAGVGGGMSCSGDPVFVRCYFADNVAENCGGVACSGSPTFIECGFFDNFAIEGCGGIGADAATLTDCEFTGNSTGKGSAGALLGGAVVRRGFFADNHAFLDGGAVSQADSLIDCTFLRNSAVNNGGAVSQAGAIVGGTFLDNSSDAGFGGAVYSDGILAVGSSTFSANSAPTGGTFWVAAGSVTIESSIIAFSLTGEAVGCQGGGTATVTCSDIYGNAGGDWVDCISGQLGVDGNISEDPLFCNAGSGDLRINALSPCMPSNNSCGVLIGSEDFGCGDIECPTGPHVFITNGSSWNGQGVSVYGGVSESPNSIDAFEIIVRYDPSVLSFIGCSPGELTGDFEVLECVADTPGEITGYGLQTLSGDPVPAGATGNLVRFDFDVVGCDIDTQKSLLPVISLADDLEGMETCPGVFTCVECVSNGDVNGNGWLSPGDARCAFDIFLFGQTLPPDCDKPDWNCEIIAADVNCTGSASPGDALIIFDRFLSGLPPEDCSGAPLMVQSTAAWADENPFDVPRDGVSMMGDVIRVPVVMEATRGAAAFGFEVRFDKEKLRYEGITVSSAAQEWKALDANEVTPGRVIAGGFDPEGIKAGAVSLGGTIQIAELRFRKLSPDGTIGPIEWIEGHLEREALEEPSDTPDRVTKLDLGRPFPNPFRDAVSAYVMVPTGESRTVKVSVYDVKGRLVKTLLNQTVNGVETVSWDRRTTAGEPVSSGVYFMRMEVTGSGFAQSRKLVVLK